MMGLIHEWQNFALKCISQTFSFSENAYISYTDAYADVTVSVNQIQPLDSAACTAIFMGL